MRTRVVCVSRSLAARGEEVARNVAERLGFRYVDDEIIRRAAEKEKVDVATIAEVERRQSLIARLLDSMAAMPVPDAMGMGAGMLQPAAFSMGLELTTPGTTAQTADHYRTLIREVIRETANQGKVVIVAHAAAMALAGTDGLLRVLITASPETRTQRLVDAGDLDAAKAAKAVKDSDRERRNYFKSFYGIKEELPTHYDLVINTDVLDADHAVDAIVAAA
jgi:cytidylate kinase